MPIIASFVFVFLVTTILSGLIFNFVLVKINSKSSLKVYTNTEFFLFSLAIAPALITIILQGLFIFFHNYSSSFYVFFVGSVFFLFVLFAKSEIVKIIKQPKLFFNVNKSVNERDALSDYLELIFTKNLYQNTFLKKITINNVLKGCCGAIFFYLMLIWVKSILTIQISEHDFSEYATQAKILYKHKSFSFSLHRFNELNGFYFVGLHSYSFLLFGTWEQLLNSFFIINSDLFLRSISGFYAFLCLVIPFYYLTRFKSIKWALLFLILFVTSKYYLDSFVNYSIDSYRTVFLIMDIVLFVKLINYDDKMSLILFSITSALMISAHSIGVFLLLFFILGYMIFGSMKIVKKIVNILFILIVVFLLGGYFYFFESFVGTGWIFK